MNPAIGRAWGGLDEHSPTSGHYELERSNGECKARKHIVIILVIQENN